MANSQTKIDENKRVACVACGKLIATGTIIHGKIKIPCKCGVMNTIGAEMKPEGRKVYYEPGYNSRGELIEVSLCKR